MSLMRGHKTTGDLSASEPSQPCCAEPTAWGMTCTCIHTQYTTPMPHAYMHTCAHVCHTRHTLIDTPCRHAYTLGTYMHTCIPQHIYVHHTCTCIPHTATCVHENICATGTYSTCRTHNHDITDRYTVLRCICAHTNTYTVLIHSYTQHTTQANSYTNPTPYTHTHLAPQRHRPHRHAHDTEA